VSRITRRRLLTGSVLGASAAVVGVPIARRKMQPRVRVATLAVPTYDGPLAERLLEGLREFPETVARARGARVVLKPNLVEWNPTRPINTDPRFVGAVAEAFRRLDAAEVVVAEGPGHRRDTELVLEQSGLDDVLRQARLAFVDLNVDRVSRRTFPENRTGLGHMDLAATAVGADLLVSLPKLKTHHWAGVTLSCKNLFGLVPGSVYGWPKNRLHWAGIDESIADIWDAVQPDFAIVDGITGMEGDGPIMGDPVDSGVVVMGDQCPAVDATATRLMGLDPHRIRHLWLASWSGGTLSEDRIARIGDTVAVPDFAVLPQWQGLRLERA
jgi:uncharacterized protein (DUF362 family)